MIQELELLARHQDDRGCHFFLTFSEGSNLMPKYLDGYQTPLGSRFNTVKLADTLNKALIQDNLFTASLDVKKQDSVNPVFITGLHDSQNDIPAFPHPYFFTPKVGDRKPVLATDVRLVLRKATFDGSLASLPRAINNRGDFDLARHRTILNLEWIEEDAEALKNELWFATAMFARWVTDALTRALKLDGREQLNISIACCYYYQALFTDVVEYDEDTLQRWTIHTSKAVHCQPKEIAEVFAKMPKIKGAESLMEALQAATDDVRVKETGLALLLTLLKGTWFGINGKELVVCALEHPPTWMAMVYSSLHDRTFKKSVLSQIADRVSKRGMSEAFDFAFRNLLDKYQLSEGHRELIHHNLA